MWRCEKKGPKSQKGGGQQLLDLYRVFEGQLVRAPKQRVWATASEHTAHTTNETNNKKGDTPEREKKGTRGKKGGLKQ